MENDRDFFSEITEDDITAVNDSGFQVTDELPDIPAELFKYYNSHYKYALFIKSDDLQLEDDCLKILDKLINRVLYFLDQMEVEHSEFIIRDRWMERDTEQDKLHVFDINSLKFITIYEKTELVKRNGKMTDLILLKKMYITTFINIPEFENDAKQLYRFFYRLLGLIWKIDASRKIFTNLVLARLPMGVNSFYIRLENYLRNTLCLDVDYKYRIDNDNIFDYKQHIMHRIEDFIKQ